jgi:hypothetical protein
MSSKELHMKATLVVAVIMTLLLIPLSAVAQVPTPPDVPTLGPVIICDLGNYINISSPTNRNYPGTPIQLTFTINVTTMLGQFGNVGYSVDGGVITSVRNLPTSETRPDPHANNTIWYYYTETASTSITLPQLANGAHNVTVYYGWQYLGIPENPNLQRFEVYSYQTVNFTIGALQPAPTPWATTNISPYSNPTPTTPELPFTFAVTIVIGIITLLAVFSKKLTRTHF